MIKLFKPFVVEEAIEAASAVLRSGTLTQGSIVDEFERRLAEVANTKNIVTVNSATSAISLAITLIKQHENLGPETEVLSPPLTCFATNVPVIHNGMKIKWYDMGDDFARLNLEDIKNSMNENTRILSVVAWGGSPLYEHEMLELQKFYVDKYGKVLYIIEDRAHCPVGRYKNHDNCFVVYSFQAVKHLTTADGGLLIPPDEFYKKARLMRWFGLDRDNKIDFRSCQDISCAGYKYHMNDVNASIGLANLNSTEYYDRVSKNIENAAFLHSHINKGRLIPNATWMNTIIVKDKDKFIAYLKENEIESSQVHTRNDKYSCLKEFRRELPNMDYYENKYSCFSCGWWLSDKELMKLVNTINDYSD